MKNCYHEINQVLFQVIHASKLISVANDRQNQFDNFYLLEVWDLILNMSNVFD